MFSWVRVKLICTWPWGRCRCSNIWQASIICLSCNSYSRFYLEADVSVPIYDKLQTYVCLVIYIQGLTLRQMYNVFWVNFVNLLVNWPWGRCRCSRWVRWRARPWSSSSASSPPKIIITIITITMITKITKITMSTKITMISFITSDATFSSSSRGRLRQICR